MSTENKPMTPQERIKADAEAYANDQYGISGQHYSHPGWSSAVNDYIAGATAEHAQNESVRLQLEAQDSNVEILLSQIDKAQVLVDALEEIIKNGENIRATYKVGKPAFYIKVAREALEQWKAGKEVKDGIH